MLNLHLSRCACCFMWVRNLVLQFNDKYKIEVFGEGCWEAYLYLGKTKNWRMEKKLMLNSFLFCVLHLWLAIWTGMSCIFIVCRQTMGNARKKKHNLLYIICDVSFRINQPFDALHSVQLERRRSINKDSFNDLNTYIFLYRP
jgi:hypothetical protein